jgi:hypothetical protein
MVDLASEFAGKESEQYEVRHLNDVPSGWKLMTLAGIPEQSH